MKYNTIKSLFTAICDPIREVKETTELINHQDIPEAIEECFDIIQDNSKNRYSIKNSENGVTIAVNDSLDEPIQNLKVFGKSQQNTYSGKQLLNITRGSTTANGITFTANGDGTFTLKGTATANAIIQLCSVELEAGQNYTLSMAATGSNTTYFIYLFDMDGIDVCYALENESTFTANKTGVYTCYYQIKSGVSLDNLLIKPMLRLSTISNNNWEPYTDGIPSPNIDYPQEIINIGDNGNIKYAFTEKNLCPKNLLKKGWYGNEDIIGKPTTNSSYPDAVYGIPFKYEKGKTLAWNYGDTNTVVRLRLADANGVIKTYLVEAESGSGTIVLNSDYTYIIPLFLNGVPDTCIIQYSDTIPAKDNLQPLTLQIPNGLKGIQVLREEESNYTDENGSYWASDYIDFERGKYIQRIVEKVLDGSEVIGYGPHPWNMSPNALFGTKTLCLKTQQHATITYAMSDKFTIQNYSYMCSGNATKSLYYAQDGSLFSLNSQVLFDTQDAEGFKKFFSENPTKIYAILETPIEHDLNKEQIEQYKSLMMNNPNTTILNNADAFTEVEYIVDSDILEEKLDNYTLSVNGTFIPENDTKTFEISGLPFTPISLMILCPSDIPAAGRTADNLYAAALQKENYGILTYTDSSAGSRLSIVSPTSTLVKWSESGVAVEPPSSNTAKFKAGFVYNYYITGDKK